MSNFEICAESQVGNLIISDNKQIDISIPERSKIMNIDQETNEKLIRHTYKKAKLVKFFDFKTIERYNKIIFIIFLIIPIMFGSKIVKVSYDIARGVNATVWGGVEGAEKASKIIKTGLSGADVVIGTSHTIEDLGCSDYVCASLDVIGSVSSATGLVLGNLPHTKHLTVITGSITVGCRAVRYYCKRYGTVWGCTVAASHGVKETVKFVLKSKS